MDIPSVGGTPITQSVKKGPKIFNKFPKFPKIGDVFQSSTKGAKGNLKKAGVIGAIAAGVIALSGIVSSAVRNAGKKNS